jgi:hypothetical protein
MIRGANWHSLVGAPVSNMNEQRTRNVPSESSNTCHKCPLCYIKQDLERLCAPFVLMDSAVLAFLSY